VSSADPTAVGGDSGIGAPPVVARAWRSVEWVAVVGAWLLGQAVFFRSQWLSGFDRVMGDPGAARFIIYVNENWYQALLGHASWRNPGFYFPLKNNLGLSDTLLVWQVVYAPARALGADPFLAYQLVLMALSALGFVTIYLLMRSLWRPPIAVGLVAAALFTFSNALYANANHPQMFGVLLLPAVCLLGVASWRAAMRGSTRGLVWGAGFGALAVLAIYSTYYVGFFALVGAAIAAILSVASAPRATFRRLAMLLRRGWSTIVGVVVGAAGPAALFALTFLPALRNAGGYGVAEARYFAPRAADLVNVGMGNILWGSLLVHPTVQGAAALSERDYAVTPILLVASLVIAVLATIVERRASPPEGGRRFAAGVLAVTGLALLVAPLELGSLFVWRLVAWIPGASGIRAVDRIAVVANGVLVVALVAGTVRLLPALRRAVPRTALLGALLVVGALLCVEQVNVSDSSQLSRSAQLAVLDAVPAPPPRCSSFFVETASASTAHPARVQTTAMLVSERFSIPTLNGTSGSFPKGWHLLYPSQPGYSHDVEAWSTSHHLADVCALNLDDDTWTASWQVASIPEPP
jgi:hypothetical protein